MIYVLPDTNILIYDPYVVKKLIRKCYYVVIPVIVLNELDKLKRKKDLKQKVIKIGIMIEEIIQQRNKYLNLTNNLKEIPGLDLDEPDNCILAAANYLKEQEKEVIFISNDRSLRLKAKGLGIKVVSSLEKLDAVIKKEYKLLSSPSIRISTSHNISSKTQSPNSASNSVTKDSNTIDKFCNSGFLTFEQKRKIFRSFPELTEEKMSYDRFNYWYYGSKRKRKVIARELSHTGNGYVYGAYLQGYKDELDPRGWINIKDYEERELKELIKKVIASFSG